MHFRLLSCVSLFLCAAACGKQASESAALPASTLPERYLLAAKPEASRTVLELRAAPPNGQKIAIAGRAKDFVDGLSAFTLIDPSLKACNEGSPMDTCPTPWDYCCDDPVGVAHASATVEFRDGTQLYKTGLRGFHGLDHLKHVVVAGQLEQDAAGNLSVIADGIYIQP